MADTDGDDAAEEIEVLVALDVPELATAGQRYSLCLRTTSSLRLAAAFGWVVTQGSLAIGCGSKRSLQVARNRGKPSRPGDRRILGAKNAAHVYCFGWVPD